MGEFDHTATETLRIKETTLLHGEFKHKVQELRLENVTVANCFYAAERAGLSYEHTLEILVLALAERGDILHQILVDTLNQVAPHVKIPKEGFT